MLHNVNLNEVATVVVILRGIPNCHMGDEYDVIPLCDLFTFLHF